MNRTATRSALVLLALLVGVWLAFGLRSVRLVDDANAVLAQARDQRLPPAEIDAALDDYAKAGRLSPDQTPLIDQGELLYAAGRQADAQATARLATKAEPDNLQAWYLRWSVMPPNSGEKTQAKQRLIALNPWFDYALRRAAAVAAAEGRSIQRGR